MNKFWTGSEHRTELCNAAIQRQNNIPVSQRFFPSGKQPEHHILAHELKQPTAGCIALFHKYCCYAKRGGIKIDLTLRNHWRYVTDVSKYHKAGIRSMD